MESERVEPNSVSWTSLLSAHARDGKNSGVLNLFREMTARGTRPTPESLSVVLSVCAEMGSAGEGKAVHSVVVRDGLEGYVFVRNSLISFYGMLGNAEEAELLFSQTEPKSLVTWNSLISCHAAAGLDEQAYQLLLEMEETTGIRPDSVTWSAVIGGLAAQGKVVESLEIFRQMQEDGVRANSVTAATVLSACAEIAALRLGRELHGHTLRASTGDGDPLVGNALVSMYAKCGSLKDARNMFDKMADNRDLISWNSMISGYGINGLGEEAIGVFEGMVDAGVDPDGVSFVAVLSACRHAGFVSEGRRLFHRMVHRHGIRPWMEHYACMVDLLGRAGLLEEAIKLVKTMPMEPNIWVWGSLLNSCRMHRNDGVAEEAASRIFALELETAGSCMLLSNIYASCGRWEDSAR
ncbi:unnamed protein product [Spirodela intermedia]|uniref:Uncharacterized protein n=1 Tax=Spirodela intermedia TaxID=51605 RepID=A0A7I8IZL8_SPIIN|nr:unnamed protein product [Spirodela intermedia]CAA6663327.1 unnamed protein product [Spirodela intermedia]